MIGEDFLQWDSRCGKPGYFNTYLLLDPKSDPMNQNKKGSSESEQSHFHLCFVQVLPVGDFASYGLTFQRWGIYVVGSWDCFSHFYFILFYFILFYFILFYFILFYFILFYSILFYSFLFYFILYFCWISLWCLQVTGSTFFKVVFSLFLFWCFNLREILCI